MKTRTSATFYLLLAFSMGVVAGAIGFYLYHSHVRAAGPRGGAPTRPPDIVEEMARDLKMDAPQKEQLRGIFSQSRERYKALSHQFQPQYQNIRNETNQAIRQILREDQKARFEQIIRDLDQRRRERGPRGPQ
jgi:hypothetical protein